MADLLKSKGFTEAQASGIIEAIQAFDLSQVATKADLRELELRLVMKMGSMIAVGVAVLAALKVYG